MSGCAKAIGTVLLVVVAGGCAMQPQVTSVSAMVRGEAGLKVAVDLGDILTP